MTHSNEAQSESMHVVDTRNAYHIGHPQTVFEFDHNKKIDANHSYRLSLSKFNVEQDCLMTGVTSFFDTVLYRDIKLGTHPKIEAQNLASGLANYFPLTKPQQLKTGDVVQLEISRRVSPEQVEYKWKVTEPSVTQVLSIIVHKPELGPESVPIRDQIRTPNLEDPESPWWLPSLFSIGAVCMFIACHSLGQELFKIFDQ